MGALYCVHSQQVLTEISHFARGYGKGGVPDKDGREGTLATSVGTHDSVCLTLTDGEVDPFEYFFVAYVGVKILYVEYYVAHSSV